MVNSNNSEKIKFYLVQVLSKSKAEYIKSAKVLKIGRIYTLGDGSQFKVIRQVHCKYTIEDIYNIMSLTSDGYSGTVRSSLHNKMSAIYKTGIPRIRFSETEKDLIYNIYVSGEYESVEQKHTLEKVLQIVR